MSFLFAFFFSQVNPIREILKMRFNMTIKEVEDPGATIDGGDVLFTGKFFSLRKCENLILYLLLT